MKNLSSYPNVENANCILITLDSLRFDTALKSRTPNLDDLGPLMKATTLCPYTPGAHTTFFLGHLPSVIESKEPYYNETIRQPWRITTGPSRNAGKGCGILFEGNNVIEGYRRKGFKTIGVGGVSQFSSGSFLRTIFPWDQFLYFGPDMDEEPLIARKPESFPLNNIDKILDGLKNIQNFGDHFFLFINNPEPHYPYDWGEGFDSGVEEIFPILKKGLNLRSHKLTPIDQNTLQQKAHLLKQMQISGLEQIDTKLGILFKTLDQIVDGKHPTFVVVCGDHGENFGENGLWGHMHPSSECLQVPIWMGIL